MIIKESVEQDISANDVITNMVKEGIELLNKKEDTLKNSSKELLLEKDYLYNAEIDPNFTNNDTSIYSA